MMDRRLTPFSGVVALDRLHGEVAAERFTAGTPKRMLRNGFLRAAPAGARDRQLLWGDAVTVIEARGAWTFVQAQKDGYCGWLRSGLLTAPVEPTHRVAVRSTWAYPEAGGFKEKARFDLHMNAPVRVLRERDGWAGISARGGEAWVPAAHLVPLGHHADPVEVARTFIGTPYVWAGNTGFGIDCSGLAQACLHAAGLPCPGDSDLQEAALPPAPEGADPAPGDLLFWKGHVAVVMDAAHIIHANAHAMMTCIEPIDAAVARIAEQGGGPVTAHRRPAYAT